MVGISSLKRGSTFRKKGKSRVLKLLAPLGTHTHTPHPTRGSEGPSAEGQGAIRTLAPGTHDGKNPRIPWYSPLPTAHSLHSQPLWPFTGYQAPLLQPPEVPARSYLLGVPMCHALCWVLPVLFPILSTLHNRYYYHG